MHHDAIVIGGSYAGMAAALQLLRARRAVLMIDAAQRRNRFASHSHGFLGQGSIGVIGVSPMSLHQAELLTDWGSVTLLVNRAVELTQRDRSTLQRRGVLIEEVPIDRIAGHADVAMADGRLLRFTGLFTASWTSPAGALAEAIGCAMEETAMGIQVCTDAESKTSVVGVFACGDVARAPHSVSLAVGSGAMAGAQVHRSLLWPQTIAPIPAHGNSR